MKKLLSLLMVMCMLMTLVIPASATETEPTVTISGITDGDIYSEGSNIIITAETDMADVKNIDIYANGDKLPGTIIGNSGSYVWYAPSSGHYSIYANVVTTDGNADVVSKTINIRVKAKKQPVEWLSELDTAEDVAKWSYGDTGTFTSADVSDNYAKFGNKTLHVTELGNKGSVVLKGFSRGMNKNNNDLIIVPFYNAAEDNVFNYGPITHRWENYTVWKSFIGRAKTGWNFAKFEAGSIDSATMVQFRVSEGYYTTTKEGTITDKATLNQADLYFGGAWYMSDSDGVSDTLVVEKTSFENGATGVCYNPGNYRITFNEEIVANSDAIVVSKLAEDGETYEPITGYSVNVGNDYIDVIIPDGTLATSSTYKISVATGSSKYQIYRTDVPTSYYDAEVGNGIWDITGLNFIGAEFTFTTVDDQCTDLTPILDIVYPADGATVGETTTVAAQVTFPSAVTDVSFKAGDGETVSATEYNKGEYALSLSGLTPGAEQTITAIATLNDNSTIEKTITVSAIEDYTYDIHGIAEGDRILVNNSTVRTLTVIDTGNFKNPGIRSKSAFLTAPELPNVSKTCFYVDGVLRKTDTDSPFSYDIPLEKLGVHEIKVEVIDKAGKITPFTYKYELCLGELYDTVVNDFENNTIDDRNKIENNTMSAVTIDSMSGRDGLTSNVLNVTIKNETANAGNAWVHLAEVDTDNNTEFIRFEFDYAKHARYTSDCFFLDKKWDYSAGDTEQIFWTPDGNLETSTAFKNSKDYVEGGNLNYMLHNYELYKSYKWYHVTTDIDLKNLQYITYMDGVEMMRGTLKEDTFGSIGSSLNLSYRMYLSASTSAQRFYTDNIKAYSYSSVENNKADIVVKNNEGNLTAYNNTGVTDTFVVIEATYNGNNLDNVKINNVSVPAYGIFNQTYTVNENSSLFVWKSLTNLKPLTSALKK